MDFQLTEEQRMAIEAWRRFVERDIRPITDKYLDAEIPKDVAHRLLKMTVPYGVGRGSIPEADGGDGLDYLSSGLLYEELAKVSPGYAALAYGNEGVALKLLRTGSDELVARYVPGLLAGDIIGCTAISEPDAGSDLRAIRTRARRDGADYRISGEKIWISNSTIADFVIVTARTGEQEFTLFLIDRAEHGFETREISKLGMKSWSFGQVVFDDVAVPAANILGGLGGGLRESMKGIDRGRCYISTVALGIAAAALEASVAYAGERVQFGKPIAGHQLVQAMIADMATQLEAARLLVYRALARLDSGERGECDAAMAKLFTTEAAVRIASSAIQIHGACGTTSEFPVERHFRDARMLTISDGTTQINQLIVGRALLGVGAFV